MIPMDKEPEPYDWMFRTRGKHNVDALVQLRRGIEENLPKSSGSFKASEVVDYHTLVLNEGLLAQVGSWEMPPRISDTQVTRYVNPKYVHRREFADIYVECDCGGYVIHERDLEGWKKVHNSERCRPESRKEAREELREKRKAWLRKAAEFHLTSSQAAIRMGMHARAAHSRADAYGIDWSEWRRFGRKRMILTWRKLHDEYGITYKRISEAFDRPASTVRTYCNGTGRNIEI